MNKRGQIYLLVALILALVLYMLMTKTNVIYEHEIIDDFETLSRNYEIEASKFMNSLLSEDKTGDIVRSEFDDFTCNFNEYAKNQNPDFSLIYVFEYRGVTYLGNYLNQPIIIGTEDVVEGCKGGVVMKAGGDTGSLTIQGDVCGGSCIRELSTTVLRLTIGCTLYEITIDSGRPEIIIVSREDKGKQRKVYTKEEFVDGGGRGNSVRDVCNIDSGKKVCSSNLCHYYGNKELCECDDYCCWDENEGCIDKQGGTC